MAIRAPVAARRVNDANSRPDNQLAMSAVGTGVSRLFHGILMSIMERQVETTFSFRRTLGW
jgi:hypothetical protein